MRATILLALLLTGCATGGAMGPPANTISFDRAQFAFMLADVKVLIDQKCARATANRAALQIECARLNEQYEGIKRQVMTPPPPMAPAQQIDTEQIMKLLGVLIGAAT